MKLIRILALAVFTLPGLAQAHPGHDGQELTWDFNHLASHPVATFLCFGVLTLGGWASWRLMRPARAGKTPAKSQR